MPQFQCYHGTNRANAETIREKQEFQPSLGDEQWLGDGIYFFEDYKEALLWGKKVKKYSDTTIVEVAHQY
ncbi:hypothetical protein AGMMS50276_31360 [Synergistales bacterium]|nr:hypothetical protein AGMMS50276_31360 [Synergistales bacterium]